MSWKLKLMIAKDIASSMVYLHENDVIHRDLKSTNLLVADHWVIKVCDFGLARKIDLEAKSKMTICGTDDWMAPEILVGEEYDRSCDVFSFGVVLIELITRLKLTPRIRDENLGIDLDYVLSRSPKDCPKEFFNLVLHCTQLKPSLRPTFSQIEQLINFLLTDMFADEEVEYPPLRTFKPPELTLSQIARDQSFPRPYVSKAPAKATPPSGLPRPSDRAPSPVTDFTFPRPYEPPKEQVVTSESSSSSSSSFSFPRPYSGDPDPVSQETQQQQQEQEEQQQQPIQQPTPPPQILIEHQPQHGNAVINFVESELLSFPRPFNPDGEVLRTGPLLEQTDYSFPRPWNPENSSVSRNLSATTSPTISIPSTTPPPPSTPTLAISKSPKSSSLLANGVSGTLTMSSSPPPTKPQGMLKKAPIITINHKQTKCTADKSTTLSTPPTIKPIHLASISKNNTSPPNNSPLSSSPPTSPTKPATVQERIKSLFVDKKKKNQQHRQSIVPPDIGEPSRLSTALFIKKRLTIHTGFNHPLTSTLPTQLTHLCLGDQFNQQIIVGSIPSSVTHLKLGTHNTHIISPGSLPQSLTHLILGCTRFNHPLRPNSLPSSLQHLTLGNEFNQSIALELLPQSLTHLTLGSYFNQSIIPGSLPSSLLYLAIGEKFQRPLVNGSLPSSLRQLRFPGNVPYRQQIQSGVLTDTRLTHLDLGDRFPQSPIPSSVTHLRLQFQSPGSTLSKDLCLHRSFTWSSIKIHGSTQ
eukprot:gene9811-11460_t